MKLLNYITSWIFYSTLHKVQPDSHNNLPTLVWGGLGDSVLSDGLKEFMAELSQRYDTRVYGINISDTEQEDRKLSGVSGI